MSNGYVLGFSGNITRPSSTRLFVDRVVGRVAERGDLKSDVFDIEDLGTSLASARSASELLPVARDVVEKILTADILVIGSPTYKGSYTGLFKHFFDLLDPAALRGKPVLLTATGGGDRHSLIVEHQLRPLFAFFEAFVIPTAIYASGRDLINGVPSEAIDARTEQAVTEALLLLKAQRPIAAIAAE